MFEKEERQSPFWTPGKEGMRLWGSFVVLFEWKSIFLSFLLLFSKTFGYCEEFWGKFSKQISNKISKLFLRVCEYKF